MSLWLDADGLFELTGFRQRKRQIAALSELGVQFRIRPADGFPLVLRDQFQSTTAPRRKREPNFAVGD